MTLSLAGALLGLLAGVGLLVVVTGVPAARRPSLDDRLAPYLRDAPRPSRLLAPAAVTPFPTVERLVRPVLRDAIRLLERYLGGSGSVTRRLRQLGTDADIDAFRAEQVLWAVLGLVAAFAVFGLVLLSGSVLHPVSFLLLCGVGVLGGVFGRDWWLTRQVKRRQDRMLEEFPTIAELLALAVSAGEGPLGALERISRLSSGELPQEIGRVLAETRAGAPLLQALADMGARTGLDPLARFVDGFVVAIERGTPLTEVLRAQAVDVREHRKRTLVEAAGRKEIAMMAPVVFLVLPVTVIFALYPALLTITAISQ